MSDTAIMVIFIFIFFKLFFIQKNVWLKSDISTLIIAFNFNRLFDPTFYITTTPLKRKISSKLPSFNAVFSLP